MKININWCIIWYAKFGRNPSIPSQDIQQKRNWAERAVTVTNLVTISILILPIAMHMQNLVEIHQFILKIFGRNKLLTSRDVTVSNLLKMTCNNPNLDLYQCIYAISGRISRYWADITKVLQWQRRIFCQRKRLKNDTKTVHKRRLFETPLSLFETSRRLANVTIAGIAV